MQFDWSAIWPAIPLLIEGAKMTLWISVLGLAGGLVIGLLAGFARTFGGWIANHVALVFIEVIRGTPIVVQVMFIYFALPMAFNDLRIDPFTAAVVTIMINSGAYIAEITRGAVLSIHKGFREAGLALGLSRWETIRYVILPLALRRMLPPLGNQWIISIKDTSLFIVIGVAELTRQGQEIIAGNFRALEIWSAVAVFYLIITLVLSFILQTLPDALRLSGLHVFLQYIEFARFVGRIRRSRRIRHEQSAHVVSNLLNIPSSPPKGRHTRFLSFKIAPPPASILIFLLCFLTGGVMRWILFILFCLLGAPAHAVSIPGVTTTTTTEINHEPAPEPDIEQKKRPMAHWRMCWIMTPRVKN